MFSLLVGVCVGLPVCFGSPPNDAYRLERLGGECAYGGFRTVGRRILCYESERMRAARFGERLEAVGTWFLRLFFLICCLDLLALNCEEESTERAYERDHVLHFIEQNPPL
ncbi:hypothetical protein M3Y99_00528500 [Aphelenchoides fujianensis]|nr:hypothetical protein M3Y99_00528500 [Aphelenchoides fujianensis]